MGRGGSRVYFPDERGIAEGNGGSQRVGGMDRLRDLVGAKVYVFIEINEQIFFIYNSCANKQCRPSDVMLWVCRCAAPSAM
jgi:hypothetical protein